MASPVEAQVILCDAAQSDPTTGKVHMLGAGWSITSSPTAPHAIALLIKVPWDRANQKIHLNVELVDSDGKPVILTALDGSHAQPMAETDIEVGRPPGLAVGTPLDASFALNVPILPLEPGRYEWRVDIAEQQFHASFTVRKQAS